MHLPTLTGFGSQLAREYRRRQMTPTNLRCLILGHKVGHGAPEHSGRRICSCGAAVLTPDGTETRLAHHARCFFRGHHYKVMACSGEIHEYVCVDCGHPLVFASERDGYAASGVFLKKVRYFCNLLGHRVRLVRQRDALHEYACACGHAFLKDHAALSKITHPLTCLFAGHFVRFLARRAGHSEFVCRKCGHTFCFAD